MPLEKAIEILEARIHFLLAEVAELKADVVRLRALDGNHPPVSHSVEELVREDEWKGLKIADALSSYLNKKEGHRANVEPECVEALLRGGVELGSKGRHGQNVRISIRANPTRFKYSRKTDIVELLREEG